MTKNKSINGSGCFLEEEINLVLFDPGLNFFEDIKLGYKHQHTFQCWSVKENKTLSDSYKLSGNSN